MVIHHFQSNKQSFFFTYALLPFCWGKKKKKKKGFCSFGKITHLGSNHSTCLWWGLRFPACFKSGVSDYSRTLTGFVMQSRLCDLGVCRVWMFQLDQIEAALSGRSTCSGWSWAIKSLWAQRPAGNTFTKLSRVVTAGVRWRRFSCSITRGCGPTLFFF